MTALGFRTGVTYAIFYSSGIRLVEIHRLNNSTRGWINESAQCLINLLSIPETPGADNSSNSDKKSLKSTSVIGLKLNFCCLFDSFSKEFAELKTDEMYSRQIDKDKKTNLLRTESKKFENMFAMSCGELLVLPCIISDALKANFLLGLSNELGTRD